MKIAAAVLALFALEGCAEVDCGGRYRFEGMAPTEEAFVREHAARLDAWAGTATTFDPDATCKVSKGDLGPTTAGTQYGRTGDVTFDFASASRACAAMVEDYAGLMACMGSVVVHELAHGRGMDHLPEGEEGVMASNLSPSAGFAFTEADRVECVRAGYCR